MSAAQVDPALAPASGPLHQLHSKGLEPEPLPDAEAEADAEPPEAEVG
jgi:hypothetical protein